MFRRLNALRQATFDQPDPSMPPSQYSIPVTLTSIKDSHDIRHLNIIHGKPCLIGRASKSEAKNLHADTTNALFDCPVVSRVHAELKANPWAPSLDQITITDKNSMHGTRVNGQTLRSGQPMSLRSGDMIQFGTRVTRGQDTHEGVFVTFERAPEYTKDSFTFANSSQFTNRGYSVPSPSEYDSDRHSDASSEDHVSLDSDDEDEPQPSSAKTTPEQAKAAPGSAEKPIDVDGFIRPRTVINLEDDDDAVPPPRPARRVGIPDSIRIQHNLPLNSQPSQFVADSINKNAPEVLVPESIPTGRRARDVLVGIELSDGFDRQSEDDATSMINEADEDVDAEQEDNDSERDEIDYPNGDEYGEADPEDDEERLSPSDADDLDHYEEEELLDPCQEYVDDEDDDEEIEAMKNSYSNKGPSPELESAPQPSQHILSAAAPARPFGYDSMNSAFSPPPDQPAPTRYDPVRGSQRSPMPNSGSRENYYPPPVGNSIYAYGPPLNSNSPATSPGADFVTNSSRWDVPLSQPPMNWASRGPLSPQSGFPPTTYSPFEQPRERYIPPINTMQPYGFNHDWESLHKLADDGFSFGSRPKSPQPDHLQSWGVKKKISIPDIVESEHEEENEVSVSSFNPFDTAQSVLPPHIAKAQEEAQRLARERQKDYNAYNAAQSVLSALPTKAQEEAERLAAQLKDKSPAGTKRKAAEMNEAANDAEADAEAETYLKDFGDRQSDLIHPEPEKDERPTKTRKDNSGSPVVATPKKSATKEVAKYAMGAVAGGVGTMAFLCSPLAEKLLEWMA